MADNNKDEVERVSANPGGLDEHRPLTTGDLDLIADYVKDKNKSSSSSSSSSKSKPKSRSSSSRSRSSSGSSKSGGSKS